ncbi:TetR/AcrR family transcriptional regulator [Nocardia sp. NPDC052278]|uniref:TetR/AcrR family transcriptional regulator n=1 Tax=unclassified Nocardia TaxID=2637762 RepID=UPI0036CF1CEA
MAARRGVGSRSSQTRTEIVRAAGELMLENGYAAVTHRGVASRAGVAPGLVQYYFPTPEELFIAVLTRWTDHTVQRLAAVGESGRPLREIWEYANDTAGTAMLLEFMALANHRKGIGPVIGAGGERVRQTLLAILDRTVPRYRLSGTEIPPAALLFLMSAIPRMAHLEETFGTYTGHAESIALVERFLDEVEPRTAPENGSEQP